MPAVSVATPDVLQPASPAEAAAAFGDGADITVLAGGTILVPDMTHGRARPRRVLYLGRAGLDGVSREGTTWRIGATAPVTALAGGPRPLADAALHVGPPEVRAQATVGGNICAGTGPDAPRGDLQAALLALGARVRSTGAGGERTESIDDFLITGAAGRLVLEVLVDEPSRAGFAVLTTPHAGTYTMLAVSAAQTASGIRVGVHGAGPRGVRATSVENALAGGASAADAAAAVLGDVTPADDALASAAYRRRVLPTLVARALADLERS